MNSQRQQKTVNPNIKFTLSLVDKLSDISFCDQQCSNVNNNIFKQKLLEFISEKYDINVIDRLFVVLNPRMLKNILHHQHVITTLTNGNPYLLYLTRIDGVNCCLYIDRKLKEGYNYPKIHCVKYQFDDELFNDTIIAGELVKDLQRRWFFLCSNLLVYKGELVTNHNIISKYQILNKILMENYTPNKDIEPCPLMIKKIFMYKDYNKLINNFIPSLSYYCRGLIFNTLSPAHTDYAYIIPRETQIKIMDVDEIDDIVKIQHYELWEKVQNVNSEITFTKPINVINDKKTIDKDNVVFRVLATSISDIYKLYARSDNGLIEYGIALVPNMTSSHYLASIFLDDKKSEEEKLNICMECKYSAIFDKWEPIEPTCQNAMTKSQIDRMENELKRQNIARI